MNDSVMHADKKLRKQLLVLILLLIPAGLFLIQILSANVEDIKTLAATDIDQAVAKLRNLVTIFAVANAVFSVAFGLYAVSIAIRILKSEQFPPPGMRVIRDTRIRTGKKAKTMGMLMIFMAIILLSTNLISWYLHVLVDQLISK